MKNRIVGFLIIGISGLVGFITYLFNSALSTIVSTSCSHGISCPMWGTIGVQTNVSIAITAFIAVIGAYFVFFGQEEKIVTKEIITKIRTIRQQFEPKKITKENYDKILNGFNADEKLALEKIIDAQGTIFQSDLVEKTGLSKVQITRILDKLEGNGLIERKRRGMTNVVILKRQ